MSKFTIVGRQKSGTFVYGYILRDNMTGQLRSLSKDDTYRLAFNGLISDVNIQQYAGKVTMKGTKVKISELPLYDEHGNIIRGNATVNKNVIRLTGKVMSGKNVVGYRLTLYKDGKPAVSKLVKRDDVIEMARNGQIYGVRHQLSNGVDILRGVEYSVSGLPSINAATLSRV